MKHLSLIGLPILLLLFFAINLASGAIFTSTRLDLTENRLFTLSEGTRNILGSMQDPVTLRYFYSSKLAKEEATFAERPAQRVREMLAEMKAASDGMLKVIEIDPVPFSEEEDQAVEFGVRGAPATSAGDMIYMAVAGTNSVDDQEVLDLLPLVRGSRSQFLEYDLTKLIYGLANPVRSRVGVVSSLPIEGAPPNPMNQRGTPGWFFLDQLRATFEVEVVPRGATELPEDIDLLLLVHPKELDPQLLFQIDQFVLGGGKAIAFLDPHCEADTEGINPQDQMSAFSANRTSDLGPLLGAWGVELVGEKIAADKQNAHRVRLPGSGTEMPYLVWLNLSDEHVEKSDPVVSELDRLHLATAGILQPTPEATTTFTPLLRTGSETMQVDRIRVAMRPDPEGVMDNFVNEDKQIVLAARVSGPITTAYPDGPPEPAAVPEGQEPPPAPVPPAEGWRTEGEAQLIVVADADMLMDQWWVNITNFLGQRLASETADNANLLINGLENLTGNADLISLRSRTGYQRPFTTVEELRDEADARFRQEEQELQAELEEAERKIAELQNQKDGAVSSLILTPEQREEIERFREKRVETRKKLRDVKYSLKKDIELLGLWIKVLNFLVPTCVALAGIGLWIFRTFVKSS